MVVVLRKKLAKEFQRHRAEQLAMTDYKIPKDLCKAFRLAVGAYRLWVHDQGPEPKVIWYDNRRRRHNFPIRAVADFCMDFTEDMMPDDLYEKLVQLSAHVNGGVFIPGSKSYADGAKCLHGLVSHGLKR